MNDDVKCMHGVTIYKHCRRCEREMMLDYVVHNLEELTTDEAVQCVREGILTVREMEDGVDLRSVG